MTAILVNPHWGRDRVEAVLRQASVVGVGNVWVAESAPADVFADVMWLALRHPDANFGIAGVNVVNRHPTRVIDSIEFVGERLGNRFLGAAIVPGSEAAMAARYGADRRGVLGRLRDALEVGLDRGITGLGVGGMGAAIWHMAASMDVPLHGLLLHRRLIDACVADTGVRPRVVALPLVAGVDGDLAADILARPAQLLRVVLQRRAVSLTLGW